MWASSSSTYPPMNQFHPLHYATNAVGFADAYAVQSASSSSTNMPYQPSHTTDALSKKRKIERACDACRRRKIKCDGPRMPNNLCTNCIHTRKTCSYVEASKPRGPPKAYVTSMEDRLEKMEALLKRLRPEEDFSEELGPSVIRDSWKNDQDSVLGPLPPQKSSSPSALPSNVRSSPSGSLPQITRTLVPSSSRASIRSRYSGSTPRTDTDLSSELDTSSESEEVGELSLSRGMKRLTIRGLEPAQEQSILADSQVRFHGKSSWFKLIEQTRKLRDAYRITGGAERATMHHENSSPANTAATRRQEFWTTPSWELVYEESHLQSLCRFLARQLPPPDLADKLIKLFFDHVNPQFPLFHRPTFERQWKEGLQVRDPWFGCLCLTLFAVASRWCDDPRVLDDHEHDIPEEERPDDNNKWQRAGWKYFNVALDGHRESRSLFHPPGLFEVQTMSLMGMFIRGTAFHPVAWLFISVGIRKAQDVGAHRRKIYGDKPSVEEELWKRAFWMLVLYDRIGSASLGRPCCSGEEDFDVDLPLEVDDEYWNTEDPERAFQQPPGKPAKIAAFNSYLKLTKIAAYALRNLYALDRSKLISAIRPPLQDVLTELNKALLEWVDSVPAHLRWSPSMEDPLFANQAATLYITYYLVQIIIYRPFLPPSLRSASNAVPRSKMPIPCIALCVNAARCCSDILQIQMDRGISNIYSVICSAHMCAAILLMNYWDLRWQERNLIRASAGEDIKSPLAVQMAEVLRHASVFIQALELVKPRWRNAEIYLQSTQFDEQALQQSALPDFEPPQGYHDSQEYSAAITSVTSDPYYSRIKSTEPTEVFDVPHITQCPLPMNLYFLDNQSLEESGLSWGMQNPVQSQRLPQISDQPQPIVYRQIPQRGFDDLECAIPPSPQKHLAQSIRSASGLNVGPSNSVHLSVIPQRKATGSGGHGSYTAPEPVSFVTAPVACGDAPYLPPSRGIASQWMHNPPYEYATGVMPYADYY
ncbi:fungal-specific transcription factor domain-containing protein [Pisolithus thermaeus]|nr:fungal-specific transcription factor domain-containing protein [Pisolithus croceorrhizus]KAI6166113.1 fungal-specific transcription factor domain-containing protein [Pisolithus thermaeus]